MLKRISVLVFGLFMGSMSFSCDNFAADDGNTDPEPGDSEDTVYEPGTFETEVVQIARHDTDAPRPVRVTSPLESGKYPVIVFFHGFLCVADWYDTIVSHLASHGFIVAFVQTIDRGDGLPTGRPKIPEETVRARNTVEWLKQNLDGLITATPNFEAMGYAGHSRGGKIAWNLIKTNPDDPPQAVAGIDPVDGTGIPKGTDIEVLTQPLPGTLPSLVIGTERGAIADSLLSLGIPCAPKQDGYAHFFEKSHTPAFQVFVKEFGHMEMFDEGVQCGMTCSSCSTSKNGDRAALRAQIGGDLVAFFSGALLGKESFYQILEDASDSPTLVLTDAK